MCRATESVNGDTQEYITFGFSIPGSNTIDGIEIKLEANGGTTNSIGVELGIGTATTTSATTTGNMFGSTDVVYTVGGPSYTFGRTWAPAEFNDGTFVIELTANIGSGAINLDEIQVKVYNSATGGGGGGGGEVRGPTKFFSNVFDAFEGILEILKKLFG